jgi:hypothetical protein
VNLTLTPAIILSFKCLSRFDPFPSTSQFCCWVSSRQQSIDDLNKPRDDQSGLIDSSIVNMKIAPLNPDRDDDVEIPANVTVEKDDELSISKMNDFSGSLKIKEINKFDEINQLTPRSFWFTIAFFVTKNAIIFLIMMLGVTAPFLWKVLSMVHSYIFVFNYYLPIAILNRNPRLMII